MTTLDGDVDTLHTIKTTAERLGCSERTVRREIERGALSAHRIGPGRRLVRIRDSAIVRYLKGCQK